MSKIDVDVAVRIAASLIVEAVADHAPPNVNKEIFTSIRLEIARRIRENGHVSRSCPLAQRALASAREAFGVGP